MSPLLNFASLLLPVAFLPGLMSAGTVPRWAVLALLLPLMLYWVDWREVPNKVLLLLIAGYAALSTMWAQVQPDSLLELFRLSLLIAAFVIGATCRSIEKPLVLLATGITITLPLVLLQELGYTGVAQTAPPAGLFLNKNVLAESAAVLLIAMVYLRYWILAAALAVIVVLAREKASFVGLAVVTIVWMFPRHRRSAYVLLAACGIGVALLIGTSSALDRLDIWQDTLRGLTFFGHGIGSFYSMFPAAAVYSNVIEVRPEHAHNEYLHILFELGIGSLLVAALGYYAMLGKLELERLMLVFILVVCFFAFPLHMPLTAFVSALVAGRLCGTQRAPRHRSACVGDCLA